ncbi:methylmalonyl-CoA mutase family protein [Gottfriedia acidiceleris]|uniref:methylmalonyl-CoA mutase family protein n=1 Tax=Gottfriedia acidiceleris TaxID=371036 RepID=UPI003D263244
MTKQVGNPEQSVTENTLFHEFPIPTFQQWREVAEKSLKGATIEEKLFTCTYEGISLKPMYRKEDIENYVHLSSMPGDFPYVRGTNEGGYREGTWDVCQEIIFSTPEEFNEAARNDLKKGQTMLHIALDETRWLEPGINEKKLNDKIGVSISTLQDFQTAFQDINLEEIPIYIEAGKNGFPIFATFMAFLQKQNQNPKKLRGCIGLDPLGQLIQRGTLSYSINQAFEMMANITDWSKEHAPLVQTIVVGAHSYHEAGGNAVQELAFAIATGLEYLRKVQSQHITIDDVAQRMRFSFSIGSNLFMEIAKFRAARMLWARIVKELGGNETSQKMSIHASTSSWTKTIHDPYVNILRGTMEAFGGIIGGVNSLCVSPFDEAIRPANEFSRRIARNTQLILEKEANLGKIEDPAGGSWYIESLTISLAERAWELFQRVEAFGGMYSAIQAGFPQETVARTAEEKKENIKRRKDKFVGSNIFPNLNENVINTEVSNVQKEQQSNTATVKKSKYSDVKQNLAYDSVIKKELQDFISNNSIENAIRAAYSGASIEDLVDAIKYPVSITPSVRTLRIHRGAEPFEELRMHSEAYKHRTGGLPKVLVVNIGSVSDYKARNAFITDFFEVGGFKVIQHDGSHSITEAVQTSQASIIVICSSDNKYPELVRSLVSIIKGYKAETSVLLAGNPSRLDKSLYMQAGVDDFIHTEVNNYEKLLEFQIKGGIRDCTK